MEKKCCFRVNQLHLKFVMAWFCTLHAELSFCTVHQIVV